MFDINLKDVGAPVMKLLKRSNVNYVSLRRGYKVEGRSWEMSCAKALLGKSGLYSGTVDSIADDVIVYGEVPGITIKKKLSNELISSDVDKYDALSR